MTWVLATLLVALAAPFVLWPLWRGAPDRQGGGQTERPEPTGRTGRTER